MSLLFLVKGQKRAIEAASINNTQEGKNIPLLFFHNGILQIPDFYNILILFCIHSQIFCITKISELDLESEVIVESYM